MEKEKNIMIMVKYYLKVNIQKGLNGMGKAKSLIKFMVH